MRRGHDPGNVLSAPTRTARGVYTPDSPVPTEKACKAVAKWRRRCKATPGTCSAPLVSMFMFGIPRLRELVNPEGSVVAVRSEITKPQTHREHSEELAREARSVSSRSGPRRSTRWGWRWHRNRGELEFRRDGPQCRLPCRGVSSSSFLARRTSSWRKLITSS